MSRGLIIRSHYAGVPLRNVALCVGQQRERGNLVISDYGLVGGAIYACGPTCAVAKPHFDACPDLDHATLEQRLSQKRGKKSWAAWLRAVSKCDKPIVSILRDADAQVTSLGAAELATLLKAIPLEFGEPRPIAEAISSAGGISAAALNEELMLPSMPGIFAAGEMLDWEAPTGGYLLQGCFTTAAIAAEGIHTWLTTQQ